MINENIKKYRISIMGIAATGVLLVHSNGIVDWHPILKILFGFGGTGVYVFVFLSAIGLYNSLKVRGGEYSKLEFYKRRFARLIIPYCLIAATWYGILDLLIKGNLTYFLYDISTLSFWLEHKGAWYVAMLIPIYFLFPWFYDWAEAKNRELRVLGSLLGALVLSFVCSITLPSLYEHLAQVFSSVIVYLIGYYYAGLNEKNDRNGIILSTACLILFVIKSISPLKKLEFVSNLTWSMLGIPFAFISAELLNKLNHNGVNIFLNFFGTYSLEMYLWNIFIIQAMKEFNVLDILKKNGDANGLIAYSIVVAFGCLLSVLYGRISTWLTDRTYTN